MIFIMSDIPLQKRVEIAKSVQVQLEKERGVAQEKNNTKLIAEIDEKLNSLDEIYQLNEAE